MQSDSKFFFIGSSKFPYDDKDIIFNLEGPNEYKVVFNERKDGSGDCHVCKEAFKSAGDIAHWYA